MDFIDSMHLDLLRFSGAIGSGNLGMAEAAVVILMGEVMNGREWCNGRGP